MSWKFNMCSFNASSGDCYCIITANQRKMASTTLQSVGKTQRSCQYYAVSGMNDVMCVYYDVKNCKCGNEEAIGEVISLRKLEEL